jgi:hypothetical protein
MKKFYTLMFILWIVNSLNIKAQEPVYFEPHALEATLTTNNTVVVNTVLHNASEDTVSFSFPGYTSRGHGGPDSFGYSWIDSDQDGGPDYAWNDISETGTLIEGLSDDNVAGPFEMEINFPFYGQLKNHFWINSNGSISFNEHLLPYANGPIPTNNDNIDFIAWFWDDLTIDTALTKVYYKNLEEATIVQFNHIVHYPGSESFVTAQVLMINNGVISIRYRQVTDGFETNSATIGLQSNMPELGLQVNLNESYIHSELAVRFNLNTSFISAVSPASLTLLPGQQETIWITYNSASYGPGNYEQDLLCLTNLVDYPQISVHNVMHVTNPVSAGFKGYVTNATDGLPINDVKVSVGEHFVFTNNTGYYELPLGQGNYNVHFQREGYQTLIVHDTTAIPGYSILDVTLDGLYLLAGRVYAGENPIETGFAYAYKMHEENVVDVFADMVGELGWFEFNGFTAAQYIVKTEPSPNSIFNGDYLPTYFGDVLHWEDATLIDLAQSTDNKHIHLVAATQPPQGPASISGSIIEANRSADIPIILHSVEQGTVIMTLSAIDGTFRFEDLSYGTYEIFAEIPGISVIPQTVILDETHPSDNINMEIRGSEIVFLGITESEVFESIPTIYPNPVTDRINITFDLKKPAEVDIEITDITGKIIAVEQYSLSDQHEIEIDVTSLPEGAYLLRCKASGETIVKKFMK